MNKEAGISLGTNDWWKELGIVILLGQWGDTPCTLGKTQFFSVWKREKGGGGGSSGFVTFPMCSHQVPIKQLLPTLLGKRGANDVSPYEQLQYIFCTTFGWRIGLKMPVWLNRRVLVPVFQHRMLRLAKGTAKPYTCCWLARWFDWSRWVVISSLIPFAVWVSSFLGEDWSWEKVK
jgi:hypothetical protein